MRDGHASILRLHTAACSMLAAGAFLWLSADFASAQYAPPPGGWAYAYEAFAGQDQPGSGGFTALDGTWSHDNGSDAWDGSKIGEGSPGGVVVIDGYLRLQETGDPRDYDMPDPSNRKIYLGHDLGSDGFSETALDDGVTLNFKIRVPTSGPLDDLHPDGGGGVTPYPENGDGYLLHNGGKSIIGVKQASGGIVSFSLATEDDTMGLAPAGLYTNNLNGSMITGDVDPGDAGNLNFVPLDPTQWHDVWVTIQAGGTGTHQVTVYLDGSTDPAAVLDVTAGDGNDFDGITYLTIGLGATGQSGAIDVDFVRIAPGVHAPQPLEGVLQVAGDCNQDGARDVSDIVCEVMQMFPGFVLVGTPPPAPCSTVDGSVAVLDWNGDGGFNVMDIVGLAYYLFLGGPPPASGAGCFPMDAALGCSANPGC